MQLNELVEDHDAIDKVANSIINRLLDAELIPDKNHIISKTYEEIEEALKETAEELS